MLRNVEKWRVLLLFLDDFDQRILRMDGDRYFHEIRIFFKAIPTIDQTVIFRRFGKGVPLPNMSRQKLIVAEKKIPGDVQQYYAPYIFRGKSGQIYFKNIWKYLPMKYLKIFADKYLPTNIFERIFEN